MFTEIHDYFEKVKTEIETKNHAGLEKLVTGIKGAIDIAKTDAESVYAAASPEIQAAVTTVLAELEKAILTAIASAAL